jgi:hypothetical protein
MTKTIERERERERERSQMRKESTGIHSKENDLFFYTILTSSPLSSFWIPMESHSFIVESDPARSSEMFSWVLQ